MITKHISKHRTFLFIIFALSFSPSLDGCLERCLERCTKPVREYQKVMRDIEAKLVEAQAHIEALQDKFPDKKLAVFWDIDGTMLHGPCYDYRAIKPVLKFYQWCRKQTFIENIVITSRLQIPGETRNRERAEEQLEEAGFTGYIELILLPQEINKRIWHKAAEDVILLDKEKYNKFSDEQIGLWKAQQRKEATETRILIAALTLDDMIQNLGGNPEYLGLAVQIPKVPNIYGCVQYVLDTFWKEPKLPTMQQNSID